MPTTMLANRRCRKVRHQTLLTLMVIFVWSTGTEAAPGEAWTSYTLPAEAGFDPARLVTAKAYAKSIGSAAYETTAMAKHLNLISVIYKRLQSHSITLT